MFSGQRYIAKALLDTAGIDSSYISYYYLLKQGFQFKDNMSAPVKLANSHSITYYSHPTLKIFITNNNSKTQQYMIPFKVIELVGSDIILGTTWLSTISTIINCVLSIWWYTANPRIKIKNPHYFSKIAWNKQLFVIYLSNIKNILNNELPLHYIKFTRVFSKKEAGILPSEEISHIINIEEEKSPLYNILYPLAPHELDTLQRYIKEMLLKGWIQPSSSPAAAPILFIKKPDSGLYLCINYQKLNIITSKNCYLLLQIDKMFDHLLEAKIFIKLDLHDIYY